MSDKRYMFFGIAGPLVAYSSIAISILLSPWFSWQKNALSDLGHATRSSVSPIFNLGLLLGGFLILVYATMIVRKYAPYSSLCLSFSAFSLQLVATFNEIYGPLHFFVSVLFFLSIGLYAISYTIENKVYSGIIAFIIGFLSWIAYGSVYTSGIAVPETLSSLAVVSLIVYSAVRAYLKPEKLSKT